KPRPERYPHSTGLVRPRPAGRPSHNCATVPTLGGTDGRNATFLAVCESATLPSRDASAFSNARETQAKASYGANCRPTVHKMGRVQIADQIGATKPWASAGRLLWREGREEGLGKFRCGTPIKGLIDEKR